MRYAEKEVPSETLTAPVVRKQKDGDAARSVTATGAVTRATLAKSVQQALGVSRNEASSYVSLVLDEIFRCVVAGEAVKLSSFGNFIVREKRERDGRNPKTGAKAKIRARRVVVFRASQIMRDRLRGDPR